MTITSVFVAIGGAFGPGFVVAAEGRAAEVGMLDRLAVGFAVGFAAALAAGLAAGFVAGLAVVGAVFADAADRVAFGAVDRAAVRFGAAVDRRRVVLEPAPVDPVDVSSAIAFSSGDPGAIVHQRRPGRARTPC